MTYFYQLDIAALLLSLVLLVIIATRKSFKTVRRRLFKVLLVFTILTSGFEILSAFTWENLLPYPIWAIEVINILNLCIHFTLHVVFMFYMISIATQTLGSKTFNVFCGIIYFLVIGFIATNPLHNYLFTVSETEGVKFYLIALAINAISLVTIIYSFIKFITREDKIRYISVINTVFFIFLFIAIIFEQIFKKILIENFVITILFSMLTIIFDNPNKFFHKQTTIFNEYTYHAVFSKKIKDKVPFTMIAFTFADLDIYVQKIGRERTDNIAIITAQHLQKVYGEDKIFIIGRNVIVLDATGLDIEKEVEKIDFNCHKHAMERNHELDLNGNFCVVDYPTNIDNMSDIHDYIYAVLFNESFDDDHLYKFNEELLKVMLRKKKIIYRLYDAIENDGFVMNYQPIYNWKTNKFEALEALVRLKDGGDLGFISPAEFIPLAEQNGLIYEIDEIIFEKVCRFIRNNDLPKLGVRFIDINMSLYKLIYPAVVDRYFEIAQRFDVDPSFINLEITETAEGDEKYLALVKQNIARFREKGFNFSLDDYGSGYSSVIYMAEMDTKIVKIDASIIWNAIKNKKYFTVLENCVRLVYCFDKSCVAEGVETEQMATMLKKLGVDYFQGYLYSKPVDEQKILELIKEKNSLTLLTKK